jgi:cytochrome c-type protein NapB
MRRKSGESMMEKSDQRIWKIFFPFAGICMIATVVILLSAFSYEHKEIEAAVVEMPNQDFDYKGAAIFENYDRLSKDYLKGTSTERTLSEYYSLRQYPGSPPYIPHPVEVHGKELECLACHANGGWTETLKRITPLTPHAQQISCMQCHVWPTTDDLFRETDWQSVSPPRLGRSYLPGAPAPIPHDLQMRGNCIACHVGPGTVATIRVEHPSRGNCRQCHVTDSPTEPFQRKSLSE